MNNRILRGLVRALFIIAIVYLFLLSIKLLGHSFKMFGKGFAEAMLQTTSNPFTGLIIGIVATSLIQSSSTTTSIVIGMVAGGALNLYNAIPIIMGANIGTTITNTLVALAHIRNKIEFERAFSASIVHDIFNICAVIVYFPLEINFHIIARVASELEKLFSNAGGVKMFNPLKFILNPVISFIDPFFASFSLGKILLMILSLILLFSSLSILVTSIRKIMLKRIERIINYYLFRNDLLSFLFGIILTSVVQSSSVTTSLIIPLAGAGIISIRKIYPYTLGANIGTTVTAILAALATQNQIAITVAFSHLCFNILGIVIFYPLKFIPIKIALFIGQYVSVSTKNKVVFIFAYLLMHFIPIIFILLY